MQAPRRPTLFPYTTLFRSRTQARHSRTAGKHVGLVNADSRNRSARDAALPQSRRAERTVRRNRGGRWQVRRSEEHTSELQSRQYLVCRLLLEKKKKEI